MKKEVKKEAVVFLIVIGLVTILNTMWQILELIILGEVRANIIDTIIVLILMPFIFKGVRLWLKDMWNCEGGVSNE